MGFLLHALAFLVPFVKKLEKFLTKKRSRICPKRPFLDKEVNGWWIKIFTLFRGKVHEKEMHVIESPFIWLSGGFCLNTNTVMKNDVNDTSGLHRSCKNINLLVQKNINIKAHNHSNITNLKTSRLFFTHLERPMTNDGQSSFDSFVNAANRGQRH